MIAAETELFDNTNARKHKFLIPPKDVSLFFIKQWFEMTMMNDANDKKIIVFLFPS